MSSHTRKLGKTLGIIEHCKQLIKDGVTDEYSRGVYNGMEYMSSILENQEPEYIEKDEYEMLDTTRG